jgi:NitT/TauT family transport system substrate-binding protein
MRGVLAIVAALTVAACGSPAGSAAHARHKLQNVTVAAVPSEGAAGLYVALGKGMFARAGLHVTIQASVASTSMIPAMLHGSVDVDYGAYTAYIGADAAGAADLRVVAPGFALGPHVQEIIVSDRSHITSIRGLKGETIAVNVLSGVSTDLLYNTLASYGITPQQVHIVAVPFPLMASTLAAGKVDAIETNEPFVTETVQQAKVEELADIDTGPSLGFPISGYGVLASWARRNPRAAAAFTRVVEQGNAIAATHLRDLQQAMSTVLHLSPNVTDVMATGIFPTTVNPVQLQRVANLMLHYGQLKKPFDVKPIIGY